MKRIKNYRILILLILLVFIFGSCGGSKRPSYSMPIRQMYEIEKSTPIDVAKAKLAKYTGMKWVEKPFLVATVSIPGDKFIGHTKRYYEDKFYINYRDILIGKHALTPLYTLEVTVKPMEFVKETWPNEDGWVSIRLHIKKIRVRNIEEEEELLRAFISLGARYGHAVRF